LNEAIIKHSSGRTAWACICECGVERDVRSDYLYNNRSLSCGCLKLELTSKRQTTHGATKKGKTTAEYRAWQSIKTRCYDESVNCYPNYGGRGVAVCDRWLNSFENFLADVGLRPSVNHSADRFPNTNGNYEPNNFRWATRAQQNRNQRRNVYLEYNGERMVLKDWATRFGVRYTCISVMLKSGRTFEQVVEYYQNKNKAA